MRGKMGLIAGLLSAVSLTAAEGSLEQVWPKAGRVELTAGDYGISVLAAGNGRLSGFSYRGQELFVNPTASSGTHYEPFQKETRVQLRVTVDGTVPAKVGTRLAGQKLVLDREVIYGDIRLCSRYTLTPEGLLWTIRYKIEDTKTKPKYFYLFTMPWSQRFTEYVYCSKGKVKDGKLVTDGKWKINEDLQTLVLYDPSKQIGAVSQTVTPIPTEIRRHALWDHKAYHKYYLLHKRPKWEAGYESPEYGMIFQAFQAAPADWRKLAEGYFSGKIPQSASSPAAPAGPKKTVCAAVLDFESDAPDHVTEEPYQGTRCYKFAGNGKSACREFPLKLEAGTAYRITLQMKKEVAPFSEAKKITFQVGSGTPGSPKFRSYLTGGDGISGDGKWNDFSGTFDTPAGTGSCTLALHNPTSMTVFLDDVRIEKLGKPAGVSKTDTNLVTRPLPPFTDADAAKEDWLTNRRGIEALDDDFILPPFSPVKFSGKTASVWGRDYTFGKFNLLDGVKILGKEFLAAPMEFTAVVNGKQVEFKTGPQIVLRQKKGIVELYSRASSPDVDIEVRTAVEYDGMIKVDFTFDPRGSVRIDKFQYAFACPEKYAQFIHYTGAREGRMSLNVPRISNTRRLPEGQGSVWKAPFKILVWLGTYDRGLLWFCGSEQGWSPHARSARKQGMEVIRKEGTVKLVVTPVSEPKLIGRRTTYTFGLMATPVRPRTPGWRLTDMNYEYYAKTAKRKYGADTPLIYSSGSYDFLPPATRNPEAVSYYPRLYNIAAYRQRVENVHKQNSLFGIYIDPILCNLGIYRDMSQYSASVGWDPTTDNADAAGTRIDAPFLWQPPEVKKYFAEWHKEPIATAPYSKQYGERQFQPGLGSRYADLFCYLLEQHAENGCDGVANLDEWGPVPDQNARHDMGYYEADGQRYPEYDWFGRRDLIKRMCAVFYKKLGRLPVMRVHLAATLVVPIASFCDSVITGESINSGYFQRPSLLDKYTVNREKITESFKTGGQDFLYHVSPPDRWVIEYGGQAFGWNVCIMSNLTKSPGIDPKYAASDAASRDYLAMCLIHDNTLFPVFCKPDSAYRLMKIKQDFRIGDPGVKFHSWWEGKQPVTVDGTECYTGIWQNGKNYLVAVANLSLRDQDLTVTLDKKIFPAGCKIVDAETKGTISAGGHSFRTRIPRRNYQLYLISR